MHKGISRMARAGALPAALACAIGAAGASALPPRANAAPAGAAAHGDVGVLYDQSGTPANGTPAQAFPSPDDAFSAEAADDFHVDDPEGWRIASVRLQASISDPDATGVAWGVAILPDDGGVPGSVPACSSNGLAGILDAQQTWLELTLPESCPLPAGSYWLSVQASAANPPQVFWSGNAGEPVGAEALWRNPGGAFEAGCTEWAPLSSCSGFDPVGGGSRNYLFQLVGTIGAAGDGVFCDGFDGLPCTARGAATP
jgi:hypothetical protein